MIDWAKTMIAAAALALLTYTSAAQGLHAIEPFPLRTNGPELHRAVQTGEPFTVAGPGGVILGQQQGTFEAWLLPVKIFSHLSVQAEVQGYPVPLDLNAMAREIEVRPDRTTITYSHIALTVRQIMFAPAYGAFVLFQVDSTRPVTLTLSFTPELREMWPKPSSGATSPEWDVRGFYVLHSDLPSLAAAIAVPGATSGVMAPYQERPQTHPLQLILHVDPVKDRHRFFPLLMTLGTTNVTAANDALAISLSALNDRLPALYAEHASASVRREQELTSIVTPDAALNRDLTWAETSIDQLRARTQSSGAYPSGEIGLVAGYYASGDSARPGFGWYFGRDTLYTLSAIDSYGDFPLARTALEFLLRRQRADGKAMHEYSQTAAEVDWANLPYEYAAADATPLLLTAMLDYVRSSGDVEFLQEYKDNVMRAWSFETTHDSDGDGVYDNAQGTGWVESWPGGMPRQEIYLALLDEQASAAMAQLAALLGENAIAAQAAKRSLTLHATVEREYFLPASGLYAFSRNAGALDTSETIFPTVAWWNGGPGLDHPKASLRRWASQDFATDWGQRDVAQSDPVYDPISYHQGSVWPLFTGWASLAEYRAGHPLAGYQALMQNADLTEAQDPGAVTELLSGAYFEPFGRSTSHQLWSSAMVATPLLRGLFGIEVDALHQAIRVAPHLPADWASAQVHRLHVGPSTVDLTYRRDGEAMIVSVSTLQGPKVHLEGGDETIRAPLPAVEVSIAHGLPLRGSRTSQPKIVEETLTPNSLHLVVEAVAGSEIVLTLRRNRAGVKPVVEGADLTGEQLRVRLPAGSGYVSQAIILHW